MDPAQEKKPTYALSRWLFLRMMGIVYLLAFASFWPQIPGLIGRNGILPTEAFLQGLKVTAGALSYWLCPTLAWFNASDQFLQLLAAAGVCLALLVVLGVLTAPSLALLYVLYLSLVVVGRTFMQFQWDALLLEAGFLSIFFPPWVILEPHWGRAKPGSQPPPSAIIRWLFWWLLFRVMFMSGAVKLLSGDPVWRDLTALSYHWYTQPLPTPLAWYVELLPMAFQKFCAACTFVIELIAPWFIFAPGRFRLGAAALTIFLQLLIAATGNYCFFNLLTVVLCLLLLDDRLVRRVLPGALARRIQEAVDPGRRPRLLHAAATTLAAVVIFASGTILAESFLGLNRVPAIVDAAAGVIAPFNIVNGYGLFAIMTTSRHEIVVEGSNDAESWSEYEFKYKPGDTRRVPPWVAPHQPRLDWQMWFAALSDFRQNPWFVNFMIRLLQGAPDVLALLEKNPFPDKPPRYVRAMMYDYHFTDPSTRSKTGRWWRRELLGPYFPAISIENSPAAPAKRQ